VKHITLASRLVVKFHPKKYNFNGISDFDVPLVILTLWRLRPRAVAAMSNGLRFGAVNPHNMV
jgi:hypothetical protein